MQERRRLGRVKVPEDKLSCRIIEPQGCACGLDFLVNNINPNGFSFISDKNMETGKLIKLRINFPYIYPDRINDVWVKIVYSYRVPGEEKILIGASVIRKRG